MIHPQRARDILKLALPIIGGMASQNVLNLIDTAMVGVLGAAALAAVGMASFANFMASAFITGLSAGVQAMAARRLGEGRPDETARPLNGGLLVATILAVPLSIGLFLMADRLFGLLVSDPEVVDLGVPYFRARLLAMTAIGMNFAFRGYFNGVNMSRIYLQTLLIMHASNVFLNWVLIFGHLGAPALGVTGAGIGTAVSTGLGTVIYIVLATRHVVGGGFLRRLPDRRTMITMLRLSIPAGLQRLFFAAGMTAFFWIVARVGTAELAASNVLVQLLLVVILPGVGFGLGAASFVGQSLGRGDEADARAWGWDVSKLAVAVVVPVGLLGLVAPRLLLSGFIHDPGTLELAVTPLRLVGATVALDTVGTVLLNALLGAGDTRRVMAITVTMQWCLFLPAAYLVGPFLGLGMVGVWALQVIYRSLQALVFIRIWQRGDWTSIAV